LTAAWEIWNVSVGKIFWFSDRPCCHRYWTFERAFFSVQ